MPLNAGTKKELRGRPKGAFNVKTLEQRLIKKDFDQRVMRISQKLFASQASLALGQQFLFKIDKEFVKTGTKKNGDDNGYWKNLPPKLVTDQFEIESYLESLANGDIDDDQSPDKVYYFITTKEPNNNAVDSLLNRVHGKPKESIEMNVEVFSLKQLHARRQALQNAESREVTEPQNTLPDGLQNKNEPEEEKSP